MVQEEVLKIILNRLLHFFIEEANINLTKTDLLTKIDNYKFNKYTSAIKITGTIEQCVILSFSQNLIEKFQKEFIPQGYSQEETNEMVSDLPSEVANNIIGLALSSFPNAGKDIHISSPIVYSEDDLVKMSENTLTNAVKVQTQSGDIVCYIRNNHNQKGEDESDNSINCG